MNIQPGLAQTLPQLRHQPTHRSLTFSPSQSLQQNQLPSAPRPRKPPPHAEESPPPPLGALVVGVKEIGPGARRRLPGGGRGVANGRPVVAGVFCSVPPMDRPQPGCYGEEIGRVGPVPWHPLGKCLVARFGRTSGRAVRCCHGEGMRFGKGWTSKKAKHQQSGMKKHL